MKIEDFVVFNYLVVYPLTGHMRLSFELNFRLLIRNKHSWKLLPVIKKLQEKAYRKRTHSRWQFAESLLLLRAMLWAKAFRKLEHLIQKIYVRLK